MGFNELLEKESSFRSGYYSYLDGEFEPALVDLLSPKNWNKVKRKSQLTKFLAGLMIRFYGTENRQKAKINREQLTTGLGGDYYENMIALFLRAFLRSRFIDIGVSINKKICKGFIPDVAVWMNDKPIAALELKLHFNWRRDNDENSDHFRFKDLLAKKRSRIYSKLGGDDRVFVLVLSRSMLDRETEREFRKNFPFRKNRLFVVLHRNPRDLGTNPNLDEEIIDHIEDLFEDVADLITHGEHRH